MYGCAVNCECPFDQELWLNRSFQVECKIVPDIFGANQMALEIIGFAHHNLRQMARLNYV